MSNNYQYRSGEQKKRLRPVPVTIEFVGPPGAGKTTSCRCLAKLFERNGYKVCTSQDIKDSVRKMGFVEKIFFLLKLVVFKGPLLMLYIVSLANKGIYSKNSIYRYIRLTLFNLVLNKLKKNGKIDIVLLDQWIIQEMWSATIFRAKSYNGISKSLSRFYFSTDLVFYFDIDINTASERIALRLSKMSRFDRMSAEKRLEELEKYTGYLFKLYESSNCRQKYLFSGHNSSERNADLVMEQIKINFQLN